MHHILPEFVQLGHDTAPGAPSTAAALRSRFPFAGSHPALQVLGTGTAPSHHCHLRAVCCRRQLSLQPALRLPRWTNLKSAEK